MLGEDTQTLLFRGRRSRNKVSVGEPAEGSLPVSSTRTMRTVAVLWRSRRLARRPVPPARRGGAEGRRRARGGTREPGTEDRPHPPHIRFHIDRGLVVVGRVPLVSRSRLGLCAPLSLSPPLSLRCAVGPHLSSCLRRVFAWEALFPGEAAARRVAISLTCGAPLCSVCSGPTSISKTTHNSCRWISWLSQR